MSRISAQKAKIPATKINLPIFYLFWRDFNSFVDIHRCVRSAAGTAVVKRSSEASAFSSSATGDASNLNIRNVITVLISLNRTDKLTRIVLHELIHAMVTNLICLFCQTQ